MTKTKDSVQPVEWGAEVFCSKAERAAGASGWIAAKSCGGKKGAWTCVTHSESFDNNMQKDSHISRGEHILAWRCFECGNVEVP